MQYMALAGALAGYPTDHFSGKRALARGDFAAAARRLCQELGVEPRSGGVSGPAPAARATGTGASREDAAGRRRVLLWTRPLVAEFTDEIRAMGGHPEAAKQLLDRELQAP
jgi:hypothetical protein